MINYIRKVLFLSAFLLVRNSSAAVHEFETTHMKSTGGAGVAAIQAEESAFYNPAALAFATNSTAYIQKDTSILGKAIGYVLCDGNPNLSGSISYIKQEEDDYKRSRLGISFSSLVSANSSAGISLRKSTDDIISKHITNNYYQTVLGVTHVINEQLSLGIVAYDPLKSLANETKALVGIQYGLAQYIVANFDFGGNYTKDNLQGNLIYKGSLQITVLNDLFLKFGAFADKEKSEKGTGMGLSWSQPRLAFAFANKNFTTASDRIIKETSLSASIRF
jgi:hypothetical protein